MLLRTIRARATHAHVCCYATYGACVCIRSIHTHTPYLLTYLLVPPAIEITLYTAFGPVSSPFLHLHPNCGSNCSNSWRLRTRNACVTAEMEGLGRSHGSSLYLLR